MVEVGGHPDPLAHHEELRRARLRRVRGLLGYKGDSIKDFFLNYRSRQGGVSVDLARAASTCTTPAPAKAGRSTCWRPD
jgi:hypothetical protein